MKKVLVLGLVALAQVLLAQQQASAWCKYNFGVGLNVSSEGANNSVLWGVAQGGPGPGMANGGNSYPNFSGGHPIGPDHAPGFAPSYPPSMGPSSPAPGPMPLGTPGVAQPVGYFPYGNPAGGYNNYPSYSIPMYYYYPMVPR